jgi:hypothetical protein
MQWRRLCRTAHLTVKSRSRACARIDTRPPACGSLVQNQALDVEVGAGGVEIEERDTIPKHVLNPPQTDRLRRNRKMRLQQALIEAIAWTKAADVRQDAPAVYTGTWSDAELKKRSCATIPSRPLHKNTGRNQLTVPT